MLHLTQGDAVVEPVCLFKYGFAVSINCIEIIGNDIHLQQQRERFCFDQKYY